MQVKDLKLLLDKIPDETELDFLGCNSDGSFYERVRPEDFIYSENQKTLIIKTDWR